MLLHCCATVSVWARRTVPRAPAPPPPFAARTGTHTLVREWWALGAAHVTARDHFGRTPPLDWARRNASASVRHLLDYGADVGLVDADIVPQSWARDFVVNSQDQMPFVC